MHRARSLVQVVICYQEQQWWGVESVTVGGSEGRTCDY